MIPKVDSCLNTVNRRVVKHILLIDGLNMLFTWNFYKWRSRYGNKIMRQLEKISTLPSQIILKQCEAIIEVELKSWNRQARLLEVIKQMELYKEQYDDFESYCKDHCKTIRDLDNQGNLTFNLIKKDENELPKIS